MLVPSHDSHISLDPVSRPPFENLSLLTSGTVTADCYRKLCSKILDIHSFKWVSPDDLLYQEVIANQIAYSKRNKSKDNAPQSIIKDEVSITKNQVTSIVGDHIEKLCRLWMPSQLPIFEKRAYLYEVRDYQTQAKIWRAGESDLITSSNGVPDIIFEVKCSNNNNLLTKGRGQLRRSVAVIGNLFPQLGAAVLHVRPEFTEGHVRDSLSCEGLNLPTDALIKNLRDGNIPIIRVSFHDLIRFGDERGITLEREVIENYISIISGSSRKRTGRKRSKRSANSSFPNERSWVPTEPDQEFIARLNKMNRVERLVDFLLKIDWIRKDEATALLSLPAEQRSVALEEIYRPLLWRR